MGLAWLKFAMAPLQSTSFWDTLYYIPSIFREKVKPRYIWLTSCELSTNNLAVVSLICGGASDPIRISTRLGNKNANFDRIEKQLLKSRYLRFMPCFCSQHRYFSWVTKIGFEDEFDVTWLKTFPENWDSKAPSAGLFRDYGLNYISLGIIFFFR